MTGQSISSSRAQLNEAFANLIRAYKYLIIRYAIGCTHDVQSRDQADLLPFLSNTVKVTAHTATGHCKVIKVSPPNKAGLLFRAAQVYTTTPINIIRTTHIRHRGAGAQLVQGDSVGRNRGFQCHCLPAKCGSPLTPSSRPQYYSYFYIPRPQRNELSPKLWNRAGACNCMDCKRCCQQHRLGRYGDSSYRTSASHEGACRCRQQHRLARVGSELPPTTAVTFSSRLARITALPLGACVRRHQRFGALSSHPRR